jgi:P-type E1-E2 ATPase
MITIAIPEGETFQFEHLVLDMNGTITVDGALPEGVSERINKLKNDLNIYLLTADTFGTGAKVAKELGIEMITVSSNNGTKDKADFVSSLEMSQVAAIGNGNNDVDMFKLARLSIVIIGKEGCSTEALRNADIAVTDINDALDLFINPLRMVATLRR